MIHPLPLEHTLWRGETRYDRTLVDATFAPGQANRSSGRWQLRFHQGTPIPEVGACPDSPAKIPFNLVNKNH